MMSIVFFLQQWQYKHDFKCNCELRFFEYPNNFENSMVKLKIKCLFFFNSELVDDFESFIVKYIFKTIN